MDVDTAFLNAPINEDIWVQVPKGTDLPVEDNDIYKLKKSLWFKASTERMESND